MLTDPKDNLQYLLADGSRALAGAWDMGNYALTNVNIDSGVITGITDLAIADGGSGQSTAQAAIDALTQVSGATNEHVLTKDTGTGNAIWKAAAGGGVTDHGALTGLGDDDHTQYLLADGSRALSGAWDMGNQVLSNVGAHPHDSETLQLDGVNSDGGAFAFDTTGAVTFNQIVNIDLAREYQINGVSALSFLRGTNCTWVGSDAGASNTALNNMGVGYRALYTNISGTGLTAIGYRSLYNNIGNDNTAIGYEALQANTSGGGCLAIGYQSLYTNTTGNNNIGIGKWSLYTCLSGAQNIGLGAGALQLLTTGTNNNGIGYEVLKKVTIGTDNVAFGSYALSKITNAVGNCAIGPSVLAALTTGNQNVGIGQWCLDAATNASGNTAVGAGSLSASMTSHYNCAYGYFSGIFVTSSSGYNSMYGTRSNQTLTTGARNSSFGAYSAYSNSTGSDNVNLGYKAGYYETGSNSLYIDNQQRSNLADGKIKALIYGNFAAAVADQDLRFNADVGIDVVPTSKLHIKTASDDARPVIKIDQQDVDDSFIDYIGTSAADATKSISTWTTGNSIQGHVRIEINGATYWMPYYDAPTS